MNLQNRTIYIKDNIDPLRGYQKEFVIETPLFRETEKHIHEQFDNLLEWVQGDLQEIIQAIKDFNN